MASILEVYGHYQKRDDTWVHNPTPEELLGQWITKIEQELNLLRNEVAELKVQIEAKGITECL